MPCRSGSPHGVLGAGPAFTAAPVWGASVRRGVPVYLVQDIETWYYPDQPHVHAAVLGSYQFGAFTSAVDVGGGHGSLLAAVLDGNQAATGTLFDLPSVIEDAARAEFITRLGDRIRPIGGDFFKEVPPGGDLYLLKFILHDWDDADSVRILINIRRAIAPGGRLAVVEMVLPGRNEPHIGPLTDLNMMVMTGGVERTAAEYGDLLAKAGFRLERVTATKSPFSVVEAVPI